MTHGLSAPPRRAFQTQVSGVADKILFGSDPQSEFEQYATWDQVRDALFRGA